MEKQTEKLIQDMKEAIWESHSGWKAEGKQTDYIDALENLEIWWNDKELATKLIHLIGEDLINYLVNEGYIPSKLESLVKGEEPSGYIKAIGLVPSCKCRVCGGIAYKVGEKFCCEKCGGFFKEEVCPMCGEKMNRNEPKEGEAQFTPFWVCPCGFHTEASQ